MGVILKIFGTALLCLTVAVVLRSVSGIFSDVVRVVSGIMLCSVIVFSASPILEFVFDISKDSSLGTYLSVMLKCLGMAFLTHICSSVCRDCGESTLGNYVELAGKIQMVIISLPLIKEILKITEGLVSLL